MLCNKLCIHNLAVEYDSAISNFIREISRPNFIANFTTRICLFIYRVLYIFLAINVHKSGKI